MRSRLWFFVPFALAILPVYWSSTYHDLLEQYKYSAMSVVREAGRTAPVEFIASTARDIENLWNR